MKKFCLDSKKHASRSMSTSEKLSLDPFRIDIDLTLYKSMIGILLYLMASRPNISFTVDIQEAIAIF